MSPHHHNVSLPSINELLPEFMMQNWYAESRERSTVEPSRSDPPRSYEARATTYHDSLEQDRGWHANPDYQSPQAARSYSRPHLDHRAQHGVSHPYYDSRPPYPLAHYAPVPSGPEPSSPVHHTLDGLRPLPAGLDGGAPSTDVAQPPRLPHPAAPQPIGVPNGLSVEPATARPSFKVHIPHTPPPSQPSSSRSPLYHGALPPPPSARSISYDIPSPSAPQSYPADPYFSPSIPASKQSLYRMQTHASATQNVEEKKHCCPHCNKRFNRPSSLNIHVNTHTGAKPFQCPYPGCNRKFNVNSNMRRHWRNHISASRGRRDSVTQLPDSPMPPTPPLTASASSSPRSHYTNSLPSSLSSNGSSAAYDSRSSSPQDSESESGDGDARMRVDGRRPDMDTAPLLHTVSTRPIHPLDVSAAPVESRYAGDQDHLRWRHRSRSSPVSRYRETAAAGHMLHHSSGPRGRSNSCNVPGCECRPISTTLRPAFPSSSAPAAGPSH